MRGVLHYLQRTAIQGHPSAITEITQVYQQGAKGNIIEEHPFTKYFEELNVGDQLITESREITADDIDQFAALSGDNFYAHKRETDRSEEHTSELQSRPHLVCRLLLEKKK